MGRRVGPRAVRIKAWRQEGMWPSQGTRCTLVWVELRGEREGGRVQTKYDFRDQEFGFYSKCKRRHSGNLCR